MKSNFKTKTLIIFLLIGFLILNCKKGDINNQDLNYPTIINKLSSSVLNRAKMSYFQKNKYIISSLNQFGFCDSSDSLRIADSPPLLNLLTKSEAIEIVNNFVTLNPTFTGIINPSNLTFTSVYSSSGIYWDGATYWIIKTSNQRIDTLEVENTQIIFHIKNRELIECAGNWFQDIYIPVKFNISLDKAKSSLLNKVLYHSTIAGQKYNVIISPESLNASSVNLVIYPITTLDKIEIRVTWKINIPGPVYYIIFVDVMSGSIVGEQETIIS